MKFQLLLPRFEAIGLAPQPEPGSGGRYRCEVPAERLREFAQALAGSGKLLAMFAADDRMIDGRFRIYQIFSLEDNVLLTGVVPLEAVTLSYPSVTPVLPATHWYEREIKDLFGIEPVGHPDPRRLVTHRGWPQQTWPMRKDSQQEWVAQPGEPEGEFPYLQVSGTGLMQVPVGPIHAGIIEPGHFRFHVAGESILELEARLFYTHRGIEKLAEGKEWPAVVPITERICGVCTVSHSFSFAAALESITATVAPERAEWLRLIYAELERIANHLNDISAICAGVGLALGSQKAAELKEAMLGLNRQLTGHRFLRGAIVPGGVEADLDGARIDIADSLLSRLGGEAARLREAVTGSDSFLDRLQTTGVLTRPDALALGAVGPAARASGIKTDTRIDHPYGAYRWLSPELALGESGDVHARFLIRFQELESSIKLIREAFRRLPAGPVRAGLPERLPPLAQGFGVTESARGSNLHWIMTDSEGRIHRYFIRSASYPNWPALVRAVPGNIIPDFPLINKSFELCYSCLDR